MLNLSFATAEISISKPQRAENNGQNVIILKQKPHQIMTIELRNAVLRITISNSLYPDSLPAPRTNHSG